MKRFCPSLIRLAAHNLTSNTVRGGGDLQPNAKKILIVEDQPHIARIMSDVLRKQGYELELATNGIMAIEACRNFNPDLVFLDIMMPLKSGLDALAEMRQIETMRKTPVVFLTAKADQSDREHAAALGAVAFLPKPFSPRTIVSVAAETLALQDA